MKTGIDGTWIEMIENILCFVLNIFYGFICEECELGIILMWKLSYLVFFDRKAIISFFADAYQKCVLNQKAFMCFGAEEYEVIFFFFCPVNNSPVVKMNLISVSSNLRAGL